MRPTSSIVLAAALAASAPAAPATRAAPDVRGTVQTADGAKVLGAAVWLLGVGASGDSTIAATTDASGAFRFSLPLGAASEIVVRRRGFQDARVPLGADATSKRTVDLPPVTIAPRAAPLVSAVVPDTGAYKGYAAAFFRRLSAGRPDMLTRSDLARMKVPRTTTLLRMLPGVSVASVAGGGVGALRLRGRSCAAELYLDGLSLGRSFDFDGLPTSSLLGVEVFVYATSLPIEYQAGASTSCGVVALWTKRDDEPGEEVLEPASMAEPTSVRLASEVDSPARLVDSATFAPAYPNAARAEGIGGTVILEMVVDSSGTAERGSIGVAASTSPDLSYAALRAASKLRFVPARAGGRPVRQLVHLAADFRAPVRDRRDRR